MADNCINLVSSEEEMEDKKAYNNEENITENSKNYFDQLIELVTPFLKDKYVTIISLLKSGHENFLLADNPAIFMNNHILCLISLINSYQGQMKNNYVYFKLLELCTYMRSNAYNVEGERNTFVTLGQRDNPLREMNFEMLYDNSSEDKHYDPHKKPYKTLISNAQNSSEPEEDVPSRHLSPTCDVDTRVEKLEKLLKRLDRAIKKNRECELSLDDMDEDDSPYIIGDKLQRKSLSVWRQICRLKGATYSAGRCIEKRIVFHGTSYPEVNKAVEKRINVSKTSFPDFVDVREIVAKQNDDGSLGLDSCGIDSLALQVFRDVGKLLKDRRTRDLRRDFGSHLLDDVDLSTDPYETEGHPELRKKLDDSHTDSEFRMEQLMHEYVQKEIQQSAQKRDSRTDPTTCTSREQYLSDLSEPDETGDESDSIPSWSTDSNLSDYLEGSDGSDNSDNILNKVEDDGITINDTEQGTPPGSDHGIAKDTGPDDSVIDVRPSTSESKEHTDARSMTPSQCKIAKATARPGFDTKPSSSLSFKPLLPEEFKSAVGRGNPTSSVNIEIVCIND